MQNFTPLDCKKFLWKNLICFVFQFHLRKWFDRHDSVLYLCSFEFFVELI